MISILSHRTCAASHRSGAAKPARAETPRLLIRTIVWMCMLAFPGGYATAAPGDDVDVVVGGGVVYDSNLFRLPDSVNSQTALGSSSKSDTVTNAYVGLRVDKPYAQQRFQLDLTETIYRYDNFSHLNYDAFDYRGAWLWHLTPKLSGTLSTERTQTLVPFEDYIVLSQQRNVRDNTNNTFNLDWWAAGNWHLLAGISEFEQNSELPFIAESDFNMIDYHGGVRHESAAGNSLAFLQHSRHGDYLNRAADPINFLDSSFHEYESEFRLKWKFSGQSSLDGRVGWVDRRHDNFSVRDFSGLVGDLGYGWKPTGKLRFYLSAKRNFEAVSDPFSSYRINNTVSFIPAWEVTAKTTLSLRLDRIQSDYRGPAFPSPLPLRDDTLYSVKLIADWEPRRNISLSTGVQRADRSSNTPTAEFDTSIFFLRAGFSFF